MLITCANNVHCRCSTDFLSDVSGLTIDQKVLRAKTLSVGVFLSAVGAEQQARDNIHYIDRIGFFRHQLVYFHTQKLWMCVPLPLLALALAPPRAPLSWSRLCAVCRLYVCSIGCWVWACSPGRQPPPLQARGLEPHCEPPGDVVPYALFEKAVHLLLSSCSI